MADLREKIPLISTGAVLGAVLPALISLNIFATKADLAEYKAEIAEKYISKIDQERRFEKLEKLIEKLVERFDRADRFRRQ